jgi:hypothetical protein
MNYKSRKPAAKKPEDSNEESKEIPPVPVVPDESPVDKNKPGPAETFSTFTNDYLRQCYQQYEFGKEALRKRGLNEPMIM